MHEEEILMITTVRRRFSIAGHVTGLALTLLAATAVAQTTADPTLGVRLFAANYAVEFRGIRAGDMDFILRHGDQAKGDQGKYVYESLAHARGLAKLVVHHTVREASDFVVEQGRIKPTHYALDDGSTSTEDDTDLKFDWSANKARGTHEDKPIELPLSPGLQDRMSAQVVVMQLLVAGKQPDKISFIDRDEIKEYSYKKIRDERLKTKIGELDTVVYTSTRPESDRVTRLWYAPSLGFIPVRGEQERKGKVETTFEIQKLSKD
jgi:hypothetical protein